MAHGDGDGVFAAFKVIVHEQDTATRNVSVPQCAAAVAHDDGVLCTLQGMAHERDPARMTAS
jgi:hypothetical protein